MNIDVFSNILLEDTFVLAWHRGHESLTFYVLASLQRTHPAASTPTHGDWACYRPGIIQFSGVSSVQGLLRQDAVKPAIDVEGSVDYAPLPNCRFNADAMAGHRFAILMACHGALRASRSGAG